MASDDAKDWNERGFDSPTEARLASELAAARERIAVLEAALIPFALAEQFYGAEWRDTDDPALGNVSPLSIGEIRAACAALGGKK
jgi:hypothetical protein